MDKKPDLIVKLFAGETLVDQSTDAELWQRVLSEIRGLSKPQRSSERHAADSDEDENDDVNFSAHIKAFAKVGLHPVPKTPS